MRNIVVKYLQYNYVVHLFEVANTMCDQHHSLVFQQTIWPNHIVKDVLANMGINSTARVEKP